MGEETNTADSMPSEAVVAADVTADEPSKDRHRKRKKHLYKSLLELMEFYLGDVNLSKDRFMSQQIQGEPFVYVDLSKFLTFNKIKALTSSVDDLAKALSKSEILQVSDDNTQVCRKTPIKRKENEDDCTIYVEQMGPDVDHDLLIKVFSEFGPVDYVSMPRYSHNSKFKGFAFIEFRDPECARKALEALNAKGCCLSPHMAPEELMSIKNFDPNKENNKAEGVKEYETDKDLDSNEQRLLVETEENNDIAKYYCEPSDSKNHRPEETANEKTNIKNKKDKKKRKHSEENENVSCKKTKTKESESDQINSSVSNENSKECENTSITEKENPHLIKETQQQMKPSCDEVTYKKNKGKKKGKINTQEHKTPENRGNVDKKEKEFGKDDKFQGKKHKRKHSGDGAVASSLEKSNEEVAEPAKKKIKSEAEDDTDTQTSQPEGDGKEEEVKQKKKRKRRKTVKKEKSTAYSLGFKVLPKREWKQLRNKYLNMQRDMMRSLKQHLSYSRREKKKTAPVEIKVEDALKSGTVIKVTLDEPISNVSTAKTEMRVHPEIRYIDVTEGSACVYLRTSTPEIAETLLQAKNWPTMEIIQGDEEAEYWKKMKADREEHLKKNKPNVRGRTKLLKRAERFQGKHITTFETA